MTIRKKDKLNEEISYLDSLLTIVSEHFDCRRYKDITNDWYSVTRYFNEYNNLLSLAYKHLKEIKKIINEGE